MLWISLDFLFRAIDLSGAEETRKIVALTGARLLDGTGRDPVENTIARGHLYDNKAFYTGKITEKKLNDLGIRKVADIARLSEDELREHLGEWGVALGGKARGVDAGGWFDTEVGSDIDAKSISHEHTYNEDTSDPVQLESTLIRLSEMVGRRLREANFHARTVQLKLRYKDFTTITRAHTLSNPTQLDTEIFEHIRQLFRRNWKKGSEVRLLGVQASSFATTQAAQIELLRSSGLTLTHLDTHQNLHLWPSVARVTVELACAYEIRAVREEQIEGPAGGNNLSECLWAIRVSPIETGIGSIVRNEIAVGEEKVPVTLQGSGEFGDYRFEQLSRKLGQPKVKRPPSMTTVPSWLTVWKIAEPSASTHMRTVSVSPGMTGRENRASMLLNLATSESHSVCSNARPVKPYVHKPWRIGRSKPANFAISGSECNGLRSPERR